MFNLRIQFNVSPFTCDGAVSPVPSPKLPNVSFQIDFLVPCDQFLGEQPDLETCSLQQEFIDPKDVEQEPEFVSRMRQLISQGVQPLALCEQGVGGTYFVGDDSGKKFAIFKPSDEEPGSPSNPKQLLSQPLLPPGGGAIREVAAYLLDHQRRAGVPETHMLYNVCNEKVWANPDGSAIPKSGSIQKFVNNIGDTTSMGSALFSVDDVHNIGVLDIRLFNMDRNGENLLVQKNGDQYRLIPIDHAYILPAKLDNAFFEWMYWRQAKQPFSADMLKYIESIDIENDANILASLGIEESCVKTMRLTTTILKHGARAGLTLFDIATMVSRQKPSQESPLEMIVARAEKSNSFEEEFVKLVSEAIEEKKKTK